MWLTFTLAHCILLALVNYIDEFLTLRTTVPKTASIHEQVGGVILVSTLFSVIGAVVLWVTAETLTSSTFSTSLALASAIPVTVMFLAYFYLLRLYPAYQVVPMFLLSSVWLLLIEVAVLGGNITILGIVGIICLLLGSYVLDTGSFTWKTPTKLFLLAAPLSASWAVALVMVREATADSSTTIVSFWQLIGITIIGLLMLALVRPYRNGFMRRIRTQGKQFLGLSTVNESLSQASYVCSNAAVALAPVASYVTAVGSTQNLFLLLLFWVFPLQGGREKLTFYHLIAVMLISAGVLCIEW